MFSGFLLLPLIISSTFSLDVPCAERLVGGSCLFDEECYGPNTICVDGRCACPINFEVYTINDNVKVCRPAPYGEGAECQTSCKPPWICRKGKCECWEGIVKDGVCTVACPAGTKLRGDDCVRTVHFNEICAKDEDCVDAFNVCLLGRCLCAPGTQQSGSTCQAVCPDGQTVRQTCRRLYTNDIDMLDHAAKTDSCPIGHQCVTYGRPFIGHCCRVYCPYGDPVSLSCESGAPQSRRCRPLTHYCHQLEAPGWKTSVCCPRPCREPTPLYINGKCLSLAHEDDPCEVDQQCEGGRNMQCVLGRCKCRLGFDKLTNSRFPTCVKKCPAGFVSVQGECIAEAPLGSRCLCSRQCPANSDCYYGLCQCRCGFKPTAFLGTIRCSNPDDPLNFNQLITGVERFFGATQTIGGLNSLTSC